MGPLSDSSIVKEIEINKSHIENFILESDKGTKKLREKFKKNAYNERNKYVERQIKLFSYYSRRVYFELDGRVNRMLPSDNASIYDEMNKTIDKYEKLVINSSEQLDVSVKMGLALLISSITDTISLPDLNNCLLTFINKFKDAGINLTVDDFSYSMFTRTYMEMFFEMYDNSSFDEESQVCFNKVYFECPKIILHIKMCLRNIINKYKKDLVKYMDSFVEKSLNENNVKKEDIVKLYLDSKTELMWAIEKDPYLNLQIFLNKKEVVADYLEDSFMKEKKFSTFAIGDSYNSLTAEDKDKYDVVIKDFYGVIKELKEFYRYEFILKDLIKRYKDKDNAKTNFEAKQKEVCESEKNREKILKDYNNSGKKNFFGFIGKDLRKVSKLHINEELVKLSQLYGELDNLEFNYKLSTVLDDAASTYDIISSSLYSFNYLEKMFIQNFGTEDNFDLEKEFKRFIEFLFNSFNAFLRRVNGFAEYNICEVIADKYQILGLKVNVEDITLEKLDITLETLDYIIRNLCLIGATLDSEKMHYICKIKDIKPLEGWEIVNEEII